MISRKFLSELLQQPFGPYRDEDVLDKEECRLTSNCQLVLYSFTLEHNGKIVGLDDSERPLGGSREDNRRFRFRGVLRLANPDWLSGFGLKTVEAELNLRASDRTMGKRHGPALTLESLFRSKLLKRSNSAWNDEADDETKLNILIQGEKGLPAVFMQSSRAPTGLLWSTKDQNRQYQTATMHVATYSQSENFFWRWRLFALMKAIVKTSPPVPLHRRTPDWFVKMYLERFAYPTEDIHRRLIYDSTDPDVDEQGNTQTARQPLKVHKSEVLDLFASQAEWFVTNDVVRREKLLDPNSWDEFWRIVRKERRTAARRGVTWGWPIGEEPGEEGLLSSAESEEVTHELDKLVKRNPVTGKSNEVVRRKLEIARKKRKIASRHIESSSSESGPEEVEAGKEHAYASDFSEESEDATLHLDNDDEVDSGILGMVPRELQWPPDVPDTDGRWSCPLVGCRYLIDLWNLKEENGSGVAGDNILYIMEKRWQNACQDRTVFEGFVKMVKRHYLQHFEEEGMVFVTRDGKKQLEWVNGQKAGTRQDGDGQILGRKVPVQGSLKGSSTVPVLYVYDAAD